MVIKDYIPYLNTFYIKRKVESISKSKTTKQKMQEEKKYERDARINLYV